MSSSALERLLDAHARLLEKDGTIWGQEATAIARERIGWIDLPERSREHLPALDALSAWARSTGMNRVVLSGMGGSSLAPEVIASQSGKELLLLDSTHPDEIHGVLDPDPKQTIFVISSKSGETIETLSHLKAITARLQVDELHIRNHIVVISDPGSPLAKWALEEQLRYFPGDADVGGRYSALSLFGLVPSALLGIDCATLLDEAMDEKISLSEDSGRDRAIALTLEILENKPFLFLPNVPLSAWIEQLVAESTGKSGHGIIPVIGETVATLEKMPQVNASFALPLGRAFYLWEWITALLGAALEVNPFDQPNVASAKRATHEALTSKNYSSSALPSTATTTLAACDELVRSRSKLLSESGYLALLAYLPSHEVDVRNSLVSLVDGLRRRYQSVVTAGIGPRYLHSTGQCHKGGPDNGVFLIISVEPINDYPIPGESYSFNELMLAQAQGDYRALSELDRPVLHAHLTREELQSFSRALREVS